MFSSRAAYNLPKGVGKGMRAGRLKTRRYKTHPLRGAALLLAGAVLGAGAFLWLRGDGELPLSVFLKRPASTEAPPSAVRAETMLTLPSQTWYALQLGAFSDKKEADALAAAFQSRGAAGYVQAGEPYRVLAAAYTARADAQSVQTRLKNRYQVESVIVEIVRPEVTFRLNGSQESLDALGDALEEMRQAADRLNALTLALDQGQGTREEALAALRSERTTAQALFTRLQALFPQGTNRSVAEIGDMLNSLSLSLDAALNASSQTALGARAKYCQLLCVCRIADFARGQGSE